MHPSTQQHCEHIEAITPEFTHAATIPTERPTSFRHSNLVTWCQNHKTRQEHRMINSTSGYTCVCVCECIHSCCYIYISVCTDSHAKKSVSICSKHLLDDRLFRRTYFVSCYLVLCLVTYYPALRQVIPCIARIACSYHALSCLHCVVPPRSESWYIMSSTHK